MEVEELKQLYQKNAPQLDPEGFKLYRAAVDMTGFDLYGTFYYEDNRGMFEELPDRWTFPRSGLECCPRHLL